MRKFRKGVIPIVTIMLLLFFVVLFWSSFNYWYIDFFTGEYAEYEYQNKGSIEINGFENNVLYLRNFNGKNVSYDDVRIGGKLCSLNGNLTSNDISEILISHCLNRSDYNSFKDVVVYSENTIISKELYFYPPQVSYCDDVVLLMHMNNESIYNESSTKVRDFSGNEFNGTIVGGLQWNSSGKFGGAYRFVNDTLNYIEIDRNDHNGALKLRNLTYSMWIYRIGNYSAQTLIASKGGSGSGEIYEFYIDSPSDKIQINKQNIGTTNASSNSIINSEEWVHIAVTFGEDTDSYAFYINGILDSSGSDYYDTIGGSNVDFLIGNRNIAARSFNGMIDEVVLWNRTLSSEEVLNVYTLGEITYC